MTEPLNKNWRIRRKGAKRKRVYSNPYYGRHSISDGDIRALFDHAQKEREKRLAEESLKSD